MYIYRPILIIIKNVFFVTLQFKEVHKTGSFTRCLNDFEPRKWKWKTTASMGWRAKQTWLCSIKNMIYTLIDVNQPRSLKSLSHMRTQEVCKSLFWFPFISICSQFLQISSCFSSRSTNCEWTLKLYIAHHQLTVYSILTVSFPLIEPCLTVSYKTAQEEYVTGKAPDGSGLQLGRTSLEPAGSMWHFHGVW